MVLCAMLLAVLHTVSFVQGEMHSDWLNGKEVLQGRWQHGGKVGYCYPSGLEKTLCNWGIYVSLVTKGLIKKVTRTSISTGPSGAPMRITKFLYLECAFQRLIHS